LFLPFKVRYESFHIEYLIFSSLKKYFQDNGQMKATSEIDDKRAEDFFSRAIAESRR